MGLSAKRRGRWTGLFTAFLPRQPQPAFNVERPEAAHAMRPRIPAPRPSCKRVFSASHLWPADAPGFDPGRRSPANDGGASSDRAHETVNQSPDQERWRGCRRGGMETAGTTPGMGPSVGAPLAGRGGAAGGPCHDPRSRCTPSSGTSSGSGDEHRSSLSPHSTTKRIQS